MTWDVFLLRMDTPIPIDELENNMALPPLGTNSEVVSMLKTSFPTIKWEVPYWGYLQTEKYIIEFSLGEEDIVSSIILNIKAEVFPTKIILDFCRENKLQALDADANQYIR